MIDASNNFDRVKANKRDFSEHFSKARSNVAFDNLGGDARLVAPCPLHKDYDRYTHLAAFVRNADSTQVLMRSVQCVSGIYQS